MITYCLDYLYSIMINACLCDFLSVVSLNVMIIWSLVNQIDVCLYIHRHLHVSWNIYKFCLRITVLALASGVCPLIRICVCGISFRVVLLFQQKKWIPIVTDDPQGLSICVIWQVSLMFSTTLSHSHSHTHTTYYNLTYDKTLAV